MTFPVNRDNGPLVVTDLTVILPWVLYLRVDVDYRGRFVDWVGTTPV